MNNPVRILSVVSVLMVLFLLALLFPMFIQDNLITPIAVVLLLIWRIIQSVDGAVYWTLLVIILTLYLSLRLIGAYRLPPEVEAMPFRNSSAILERISYWQLSIRVVHLEGRSRSFRHELAMMLAALYASREPEAVQFEKYDAMKRGEIPLPQPVYAYLFPPEPESTGWSLKGILDSIRSWYQKQMRRWTRRGAAREDMALEQVISFMESLLETGHDR